MSIENRAESDMSKFYGVLLVIVAGALGFNFGENYGSKYSAPKSIEELRIPENSGRFLRVYQRNNQSVPFVETSPMHFERLDKVKTSETEEILRKLNK